MDTGNSRPSNRKGRPNYAPEYRRQVAIAACEPGISVAKLAQAHGLNPNMVFKWRRQLQAGLFDEVAHGTTVLLPVALPDVPTDEKTEPVSLALQPVEPHRESVSAASGIEIELNGEVAPLVRTGSRDF
ncbi:transposase [Burkholderia cenocepacia]|uniref:transposase n=1 Tax=Burkholderia cenocepacia TaxID=95486 RepID=UPI0021AB930B|nr:transposase [Burkholderia cenocepacia]